MKRIYYRLLMVVMLLALEALAWGLIPAGFSTIAPEHFTSTSLVSVSISPTFAQMKVGTTRVFSATVTNDPKHLGVRWSISSPCDFGPACRGTFVQTSLFSATYRAPLPGPFATAGNPIRIIATSNADPTKSAKATVMVVK